MALFATPKASHLLHQLLFGAALALEVKTVEEGPSVLLWKLRLLAFEDFGTLCLRSESTLFRLELLRLDNDLLVTASSRRG